MLFTYFMRLGLTALAVLNPILSLIISHLMLKWEEKGIVGADATAKNCISIALTALAAYLIIGLVLGIIGLLFLITAQFML